jgi:hypothetical protein
MKEDVWDGAFPPPVRQAINNRKPRAMCFSTVFSDSPIR